MKSTRPYTLGARARTMEETRRRVMQAALELSETIPLADITLDQVASRSRVSVQTVLRHFGTRAGLMGATADFARAEVRTEREAPVGDIPAAIAVLMNHYERRGDSVMLLLAQERTDPMVREITDRGRALHRIWVESVFAPYVDGVWDADAVVDRLVVVTDVYAWKLLRRDRGLSRSATEEQMLTLCRAVLAGAAPHDRPPVEDTDG